MSNLREQDLWSDSIYLIERHDPLMGGEYGINNIQARQLACRTLWLFNRFMAEHDKDGSHLLDEAQIAENAGISERKLKLDCPTEHISKEISRLLLILQRQTSSIDSLVNLENSFYGPLYEALKLSWQFGYPRFVFELFNPAFSLRSSFLPVQVLETIRGDDSIDVASSETLKDDATYVLWDKEENHSSFVTIQKILTDKRVILYHSEDTTRAGRWELCSTSWRPGKNGMMAAPEGSRYVSGQIDILNGLAGGHLVIAHTGKVDFIVEILRSGSPNPSIWERIPLVEKEYDEKTRIWKSTLQIPGCVFSFRITVLNNCEIDHLAIVSEHAKNSVSAVRTPRVVDNDFTIDRYGALYGIPHEATIFELSSDADFVNGCLSMEFGSEQSKLPVWDYRVRVISGIERLQSGNEWWWRARYVSQNGDFSGFSSLGHYIHP